MSIGGLESSSFGRGVVVFFVEKSAQEHRALKVFAGPYRIDTLHFIPETSFTLFQIQKDHPLVQL